MYYNVSFFDFMKIPKKILKQRIQIFTIFFDQPSFTSLGVRSPW